MSNRNDGWGKCFIEGCDVKPRPSGLCPRHDAEAMNRTLEMQARVGSEGQTSALATKLVDRTMVLGQLLALARCVRDALADREMPDDRARAGGLVGAQQGH